jgi:hypothetical protein
MRQILYLTVLFVVGCQGVVGPRERRCDPRPVDNPCLPIEQQKRIVEDRLALPEISPTVAPRAYSDFLTPYSGFRPNQ